MDNPCIPSQSAPGTGRIHAHVTAGVGWIVLDNPGKKNAISLSMWRSLIAALHHFEAEPDVRCVVIRGHGEDAFCAGADLAEKSGGETSIAGARMQQTLDGLRMIAEFSKPVIAMVSGYCLGAGLAIALACDLRLAAVNARFGIPAARLGLAYNYSEMKRLVDLIGPSQAKRIVFTADQVAAKEAHQMRLVDEVVALNALLSITTAMANRIAANAPLTISTAKHTVATALAGDAMRGGIARCEKLAQACLVSEDHREGLRAFAEKRTPLFQGR